MSLNNKWIFNNKIEIFISKCSCINYLHKTCILHMYVIITFKSSFDQFRKEEVALIFLRLKVLHILLEANFTQILRGWNAKNPIKEYSSILNLNENCVKLVRYSQVGIIYSYLFLFAKFCDSSLRVVKLGKNEYMKITDANNI